MFSIFSMFSMFNPCSPNWDYRILRVLQPCLLGGLRLTSIMAVLVYVPVEVPTEIVQEEETLCSEIPGNISCFLPAGSLGIWAGESRHSSGAFCIHLTKGFDVHAALLLLQKAQIHPGCCQSVSLMTTLGKTRSNVYSNLYSQAVTHPSSLKRSQP